MLAKSDNLLAILWLLRSEKKVTAKQIAEQLEMNIRTVYRYIETLSMSGVPVVAETGPNGGYTLLNHFADAPLYFDQKEQNALYHAAIFAEEAGYYGNAALKNAVLKIRRHSKISIEKTLNPPTDTLAIVHQAAPLSVESVHHLSSIENAILKGMSIEINYRRPNMEKSELRMIDPYKIIYWKNAWYVMGHCYLRDAIRNFKVNRIEKLTVTTLSFTLPITFIGSDAFLNNLLPSIEYSGTNIDLIIEGTETAVEELCRHWYLKACVKYKEEKRVIFTLEQEALNMYIPGLLITYGTSIQIISPLDTKQKIVRRLLELVEFHS